LAAALTLAFAVIGQQADAQTLVATSDEYFAALAVEAKHIRITQDITLTSALLEVTHWLYDNGFTLDTQGGPWTLRSNGSESNALYGPVSGGNTLHSIANLGFEDFNGTAVFMASSGGVTHGMRQVTFKNNAGGGLRVGGDFDGGMEDVHFEGHTAKLDGAQARVNGSGQGFRVEGNFSGGIKRGRFINNQTTNSSVYDINSGAGFRVRGTFSGGIEDTRFERNETRAAAGGGFLVGNFDGGIRNSEFVENRANNSSGGGFVVGNKFSGDIQNTNFTGNVARSEVGAGGGFYIGEEFLGNMEEVNFVQNTAIGIQTTGTNRAVRGGGFSVSQFTGNMNNVRFEGNTAREEDSFGTAYGGGFYVAGNFTGNLNDVIFKDNKALNIHSSRASRGGGFAVAAVSGTIANTQFTGNHASQGGGFYADTFTGSVTGSRFLDNEAVTDGTSLSSGIPYDAAAGGAIYARMGIAHIDRSLFIGNRASVGPGPRLVSDSDGVGGAVYLVGGTVTSTTFSDNTFLNNAAQNTDPKASDSMLAAQGRGGAIFHLTGHQISSTEFVRESDINIVASNTGRTLFYGNTNQPNGTATTANALHFGYGQLSGQLIARVKIDAAGGTDPKNGRVLMLDPLSSQADSASAGGITVNRTLRTEITKTGAGRWALGGTSNMGGDSRWDIQDGIFTLANVRYDNSVPVGAAAEITVINPIKKRDILIHLMKT